MFAGLCSTGSIHDNNTIMNFRHLLERHGLACQIFEQISTWLSEAGERDPGMHQIKKGNQWHFGMKAPIGVDAKSGLKHSITMTPD